MKRDTLKKLFWVVAVILAVMFVLKTAVDWHQYTTTLNSAPFRYYILVNAIEFLLPSVLLIAAGAFLKRK